MKPAASLLRINGIKPKRHRRGAAVMAEKRFAANAGFAGGGLLAAERRRCISRGALVRFTKWLKRKGTASVSHVEDEIRARFVCSKCGHSECRTKELAMTGTGLSKMFDIQNNYYLFVSCTHCGYTEIYHSDVLKGQRSELSNILDLLFG